MDNNKSERAVFLVVMIAMFGYTSYLCGLKKGEDKPPVIAIQTEYIDDKCICIKCGKRFNFSEVNYLIEKLDEKK